MNTAIERWTKGTGGAPRVLVVGGASLDTIHVGGKPTPSAGGAGLYTALAAMRAGADVTMLAPHPDPMPAPLAPAARLIRWVGPLVAPDDLPRFEIAYGPEGGVTRFDEFLGAEPDMRPDLLDDIDSLPPLAFCVPFLDAALQLAFVEALAERGCLTVANTYSCAAGRETEAVRRTAATADIFFCNESEAGLLLGPIDEVTALPGKVLFITLGSRGAMVVQGSHRTTVPAIATTAVDPTGAGDTFCGTVMAHMADGAHPVEAARHGVAAASSMVAGVGPALLIHPDGNPAPPMDERARVDTIRVTAMATLIAGLEEAAAFTFTGGLFPEVADPGALDFFFTATLQQFGFWARSDGHHGRPTYATVDGVRHKGSDYLWATYLRWLRTDPAGLTPEGQAAVTEKDFTTRLAGDDGGTPLTALPLHMALANDYGVTMRELGWRPGDLVEAANRTDRPLTALLHLLDHVGGYREDPLRKKSALLAIILRQRPERWLREVEGDDSPPIVDYHIQRTCLRTGMVVVDETLRERLTGRFIVEEDDEVAVRRAAYSAVAQLSEISGKPMGAVDWFLFQMRHRCPEMTEPECRLCPAAAACARDIDLFQPVRRTTFY